MENREIAWRLLDMVLEQGQYSKNMGLWYYNGVHAENLRKLDTIVAINSSIPSVGIQYYDGNNWRGQPVYADCTCWLDTSPNMLIRMRNSGRKESDTVMQDAYNSFPKEMQESVQVSTNPMLIELAYNLLECARYIGNAAVYTHADFCGVIRLKVIENYHTVEVSDKSGKWLFSFSVIKDNCVTYKGCSASYILSLWLHIVEYYIHPKLITLYHGLYFTSQSSNWRQGDWLYLFDCNVPSDVSSISDLFKTLEVNNVL